MNEIICRFFDLNYKLTITEEIDYDVTIFDYFKNRSVTIRNLFFELTKVFSVSEKEIQNYFLEWTAKQSYNKSYLHGENYLDYIRIISLYNK